MWRLADRQIDEFVANGECEFISEFASPFALLVIADLLGVPEVGSRDVPRRARGEAPGPRRSAAPTSAMTHNPLEFLYDAVHRVRRGPPAATRRDDVLTGLATATFPDGSLPEVIDVVRVAANLFAAGQETTVRLLATALQLLGERPELQQLLRADRDRIPNFVEEMLRFESPIKGDFRLSRVADDRRRRRHPRRHHGDGAQRRREPRPAPLRVTRRVPASIARTPASTSRSGTASHTCPGAPLARAEGVRQRRTHPRPHARHHDLRSRARPGRRAPLRVRAHVHPARPHSTCTWSSRRPPDGRAAVRTTCSQASSWDRCRYRARGSRYRPRLRSASRRPGSTTGSARPESMPCAAAASIVGTSASLGRSSREREELGDRPAACSAGSRRAPPCTTLGVSAMTAIHRRRSSASSAAICCAVRDSAATAAEARRAAGPRARPAARRLPSRDLMLEDVFLAREVAVEGADRDLRLGCDQVDRDFVEAALGEESERDRLQLRRPSSRSAAPASRVASDSSAAIVHGR